MWTQTRKELFYEAVKDAVMDGATPEELIRELKLNYYLALEDTKKAAEYSFSRLLK